MKPKGFTLVETVLTLVLLSLVIGIGISAMLSGIDTWGFFTQRKELLGNGRMAMDRMVREIRLVRDTTSMAAAEQTMFTFTDTNGNSIRYSLSGSTIYRSRQLSGSWVANKLLVDVSSLEFNYYNAEAPITPMSRPVSVALRPTIRRVRINIRLLKGAGRTTSRTLSLQSSVWPRNLRQDS